MGIYCELYKTTTEKASHLLSHMTPVPVAQLLFDVSKLEINDDGQLQHSTSLPTKFHSSRVSAS